MATVLCQSLKYFLQCSAEENNTGLEQHSGKEIMK